MNDQELLEKALKNVTYSELLDILGFEKERRVGAVGELFSLAYNNNLDLETRRKLGILGSSFGKALAKKKLKELEGLK